MAPAGPDGAKAAELLRHAKKLGAATLGELTRAAVMRLLGSARPKAARRLFNDAERKQLAKMLAATNATAELLGRAAIRRRQEQAERHYAAKNAESFAELPTDFSCFDDSDYLRPLAPRQAVDYFRRLVPRLNVDPVRWGDALERDAFTMAKVTEQTLLERIQGLLGDLLETGQGVSKAPRIIDELLDAGGVSPKNPQYAEMLTRTNMMDSYNTGTMREMADPDVKESFPVWRWRGIRDGRQRHSHEVHFDKYFPNGVTFAEVRDSVRGEFDGYNDRCTPQAIFVEEWKELQAKGASVSTFAELFAERPAHPLRVRLVNAFALRNQSTDWQEFGNYATHWQFTKIPKGEVWIADTTPEKERRYFVTAAQAQYRAKAAGYPDDEVYEFGLAVERSERERGDQSGARPYHGDLPKDLYIKHWRDVMGREKPVAVWIVDGKVVRDRMKTDFVEAGHAFVYPWIPEYEIWIEKDVRPEEWPLMVLHEYTERQLMKWEEADYDDAHEAASKAEWAMRRVMAKDG